MDEASALFINIVQKCSQCFTNKYNIRSKFNKNVLYNTVQDILSVWEN